MTRLTLEERADLAEAMVPVAAHLAVLVHGDGGAADIQDALAGLDETQRTALIVVLAGMVDPDKPLPRLSAWSDAGPEPAGTVREIADETPDTLLEDDVVDLVAVERWLDGLRPDLTPRERLAGVIEGRRRGHSYGEIDARTGAKPGATSQFVSQIRRAATALGVPVPEELAEAPRLTEEQVVAIRARAAGGETDLEIALSLGVTRKNITDIANGTSYPHYGGPIRPKRSRPTAGSRTGFNHASAHYAQAS